MAWCETAATTRNAERFLKPNGVAVWIVKHFIRDGARVDFPDQWRRLCESSGFDTIHIHRAWVVEEGAAQLTLDGGVHVRKVARKSFFRRLYESKYPENSIDWETVICMRKHDASLAASPEDGDPLAP